MKYILTSYLLIIVGTQTFAQVEKIFIDETFAYRVDRIGNRKLKLSLNSLRAKEDTLQTLLEVTNTGKYDYQPIAWHIVDSFLYAIEIRRLDDLFVSVFLIRYRIPLNKRKDEKLDISKMSESMETLYYVQIIDKFLFDVSNNIRSQIKEPVYFDFIVDDKGLITIALLEKEKRTLVIYTKSISQHEIENTDNIPVYKGIKSWKLIGSFACSIQTSFRMFKENENLYLLTEDGNLFEAKSAELNMLSLRKTEPLVLLINRDVKEGVQFISVDRVNKTKNISETDISQYAKRLIDY